MRQPISRLLIHTALFSSGFALVAVDANAYIARRGEPPSIEVHLEVLDSLRASSEQVPQRLPNAPIAHKPLPVPTPMRSIPKVIAKPKPQILPAEDSNLQTLPAPASPSLPEPVVIAPLPVSEPPMAQTEKQPTEQQPLALPAKFEPEPVLSLPPVSDIKIPKATLPEIQKPLPIPVAEQEPEPLKMQKNPSEPVGVPAQFRPTPVKEPQARTSSLADAEKRLKNVPAIEEKETEKPAQESTIPAFVKKQVKEKVPVKPEVEQPVKPPLDTLAPLPEPVKPEKTTLKEPLASLPPLPDVAKLPEPNEIEPVSIKSVEPVELVKTKSPVTAPLHSTKTEKLTQETPKPATEAKKTNPPVQKPEQTTHKVEVSPVVVLPAVATPLPKKTVALPLLPPAPDSSAQTKETGWFSGLKEQVTEMLGEEKKETLLPSSSPAVAEKKPAQSTDKKIPDPKKETTPAIKPEIMTPIAPEEKNQTSMPPLEKENVPEVPVATQAKRVLPSLAAITSPLQLQQAEKPLALLPVNEVKTPEPTISLPALTDIATPKPTSAKEISQENPVLITPALIAKPKKQKPVAKLQLASLPIVAHSEPEPPMIAPAVSYDEKGHRQIRVLFDKTETEVPTIHEKAMKELTEQLKLHPETKLSVVAYAGDQNEQISMARRVSLARALAVRAYFMDAGVDTMRISVKAMGNTGSAQEPSERVDIIVE